jgi:hypothetical protein
MCADQPAFITAQKNTCVAIGVVRSGTAFDDTEV